MLKLGLDRFSAMLFLALVQGGNPYGGLCVDIWHARRIIDGGTKVYQLKNAVDAKGDAARLHAGYVAEDVRDALAAEGLDPWAYGFLCADPVMKTEPYIEKATIHVVIFAGQ